MVGPGYHVVPPEPVGFLHGLLCLTGFAYHLPARIPTAAGFVHECRACGKRAETAGELVGIDDYVEPRD